MERPKATPNGEDLDLTYARVKVLIRLVEQQLGELQARQERARKRAARDGQARTLVGARMPRKDAQRAREAAQASGRSLYRFTMDAVEREIERTQEPEA